MDLTPYTDYGIYALVAIGLLIVLLFLIRTVGNTVRGKKGSRLGISEFYEIDKSRRLILVRRDDVEHLVMIGGPQDLVIEPGIGLEETHHTAREFSPPDFVARDMDREDRKTAPMAPRSPKPAVFGDRAPNLRPVERAEPTLETGSRDPDLDK